MSFIGSFSFQTLDFMGGFFFFFSLQYHAFSYITSILNSERFSVEEQERLKEEAFNQLEVTKEIHWKTVFFTITKKLIISYTIIYIHVPNLLLIFKKLLFDRYFVYISVQELTPLEYHDNISFTLFKIVTFF